MLQKLIEVLGAYAQLIYQYNGTDSFIHLREDSNSFIYLN